MQTILSVGIDVGTSTTQVIFSRLAMDNQAGYFSVPKVSIVDKEVVYKSRVYVTPLKTSVLIDTDALKEIVADEFKNAGFTPADTKSGAVIITGESARKENSDAVLKALSEFAGEFVVSAAGPDMESVIAGKGSGAWQRSMDTHGRVINMDIGGGTTNIVLFDDGEVLERGCYDIGGRLICVSPDMTVEKISPAAALTAREAGISLQTGQRVTEKTLRFVTDRMAQLLEEILGLRPRSALLDKLKTPGSSDFPVPGLIHSVYFSGGVADMIYNDEREPFEFGDIGVLLGSSIRESGLCSRWRMTQGAETIRATVVGAGTYATSISGSTITYSEGLLPLKNIPVIKLDGRLTAECFKGNARAVIERVNWFKSQTDTTQFILAMEGERDPSYASLKRAAFCIWESLDKTLPPGAPALIVIENDIAKAMGQQLIRLFGGSRQVVSIDSIMVDDGDYVDMGRPLMDGMVIPVVVKTLVFDA